MSTATTAPDVRDLVIRDVMQYRGAIWKEAAGFDPEDAILVLIGDKQVGKARGFGVFPGDGRNLAESARIASSGVISPGIVYPPDPVAAKAFDDARMVLAQHAASRACNEEAGQVFDPLTAPRILVVLSRGRTLVMEWSRDSNRPPYLITGASLMSRTVNLDLRGEIPVGLN